MAHTLERMKGRASHGNFIGVRRNVADSPAFLTSSPIARALYFDLRRQFNGHNNGDISAADGILGQYGWPHTTIHKALKALIKHGLIVKTRQGGIASMSKVTTLYAFTDEAIAANEAKGIKGAGPSLAYRDFVPEKPAMHGRKKAKVHTVYLKVHDGNLQRYTG